MTRSAAPNTVRAAVCQAAAGCAPDDRTELPVAASLIARRIA